MNLDADVEEVTVFITFENDFSTFVGDEAESFIDHIKPQIATAVGVDEERLVDFNVYEGNQLNALMSGLAHFVVLSYRSIH